MKSLLFAALMITFSQGSFAGMQFGVDCSNSKYHILVIPFDANSVEVSLLNLRSKKVNDDNIYQITKVTRGSVVAEIRGADSKVIVSGLDQENIGAFQIKYNNKFLEVSETFKNCDIIH